MCPIASREKLCKCSFWAATLVFALLLMTRNTATGADGLRGSRLPQAAAIAPPNPTAVAAMNTFEISSYQMSGVGQPADPYTEQLYSALKHWKGLVSDVEPSDKSLIATFNECKKNNTFCDVVGVTEEYAEDHMVLTLTVWSVPRTHRDLHKQIDGEEHPCNPRHCGGREGCRAVLFKDIVEELAGLDRDHKGGGK